MPLPHRICIDFHLRAIAFALRATFIPDPQRESFIANEFFAKNHANSPIPGRLPATLTRNPPFLMSFPEK